MKGTDVDWIDLTERMVAASRVSFADVMERKMGERFYAFILYTDGDCYTVVPSANSIDQHQQKLAKHGIDDPQNMAGYKWSIGEWAYEAWKAEAFDAICQDVSAASQSAYENAAFPEFRQQLHACMINALAVLDAEGFFGPRRNEMVLFISSTDQDEAIHLENSSAQSLNPPEIYEEFLKRYAVN